jgi:hypothetical protein
MIAEHQHPSDKSEWDGKGLIIPTVEAVNHPSHYGGGDNPHEHVKCATAWGLVDTPKIGAWLYNASKYVYRAGKKPGADTIQDLEKAVWYLQRAIARLKGEV